MELSLIHIFRRAFDNFDAQAVSAYGGEKLAALQSDAGIIRNRLKLRAAVGNARVFLAIQQEFGSFASYLWGWTGGQVVHETGPVSYTHLDVYKRQLRTGCRAR